MKLLLIFATLINLQFTTASYPEIKKLWVLYDDSTELFALSTVKPKEFVAVASFANTVNQTGWAKLEVTTVAGDNFKYSASVQAYAAGYVEGTITRSMISMHWQNTMAYLCPREKKLSTFCQSLKLFLTENLQWMKAMIEDKAATDPYWYQVQLYLQQIAGLQDGYRYNPGILNVDIDVLGLYLMQVDGDLEDLSSILPKSKATKKLLHQKMKFPGAGHCSALIRLLPDNVDLYAAQDTWSSLSSMLKVLKKWDFQFTTTFESQSFIAGQAMTFSSYPGVLLSGDDFYTISSGLLTMETTIGNSNSSLNKYVNSSLMLEGIRNMVANRLANTGQEWVEMFSNFNSGTYNNQWMIIDYKKFLKGSPTSWRGMFYLLEQIPGTIQYADMTDYLYKNRYYGSYNIPYFPKIFNMSGQPPLVKKYGNWFTYDKSPRALIFKRDAPNVADMTSMTKLMRYNNFKNDPLSRCNCTPPYSAENAIAARDDLNPADGVYPFSALGHRPHIATDMKLANSSTFQTLSFLAISGPTYDDLPAFRWSSSTYRTTESHIGQPDLFKFPVIYFNGTDPMQN